MKLAELAQVLGAELHAASPLSTSSLKDAGNVAGMEISGVAGIENAGPDQLSFVANPKYAPLAHSTAAGAILVEPGFAPVPVATLRVTNPYLAFARAIELFYQAPRYAPGIHPTAVIAPSAVLGEGVHVGPYVVIGADVVVGDHGVILAHVVIYEGVRIGVHFFAHAHAVVREHCLLGDHVTLQNGAVIGADGFGFARGASGDVAGMAAGAGAGEWSKIPQSGRAVLEDYVEVQALAAIDRASVGETRIGRGAKIDNLVQVGHGSTVGAGTLLCAQVGLAGSTRVGRNVILAGQVGVAGHCTIGDGAVATAQSGIPNDVPAGAVVSGYPAIPNRQWLRASAVFARLPATLRKLQKTQVSEKP
jgi:UDP-3-O-[3-hydroxymyristoyl] glucosamine N-acyltransferase